MKNKTVLSYPALMIAVVFWASSFIVFKLAFKSAHPYFIIWGRMIVASLCFLVFLPRLRKLKIIKSDVKYLILMAILEPCIYFLLELKALQLTEASQAGMITALNPILVAIAAYFLLKEDITITTIAGFFIAAAGSVWLSVSGSVTESAPNPPLGNFLEFLAMVSAAGYTIILKKMSSRYSAVFLTAVQAYIGMIFFTPFVLMAGVLPKEYNFSILFPPIYLGIFVSFIAYGCFNYAVGKIPAAKATAFVNLIPVFSLIMAAIVLGEKFNIYQYTASAMVLAGVYLTQTKKRIFPEF